MKIFRVSDRYKNTTKCINVTLDNKTSLKSLECICSNSQKYMVWVKIIKKIMPKNIKILSRDHFYIYFLYSLLIFINFIHFSSIVP